MEGFSGIDVTPLMDLTFLLLIVFMITAPMLEYAVDVSPPKMDAQQLDADDNVLVTLDASGTVHLGRVSVTGLELPARLSEIRATRPGVAIFIRADEARPYGEVIALMRNVRHAGLTNVSLVTQAEE